MILQLTDNSKKEWREFGRSEPFAKCREKLLLWGGYSLEQIRNEGLSVSIGSIESKDEDFSPKNLFSIEKTGSNNPLIKTHNLMGFLEIDDNLQIQITSRFDSNEKNYFLHYLLQKVFNVSLLNKTRTSKESLYDLLYYVFPYYLNAACKQGIFRKYTNIDCNDANVKGPIDVARHIRVNVPFNGKIAYRKREYATDNYITQLVRHTIEFIRARKGGKAILNGGKKDETRKNVERIIAVTESYNRNDRSYIISKLKTPVTHPYYTAYETLRKICLMILAHKKLNCGTDNVKMRGILFDGASLWEEYLNVILSSRDAFGRDLLHPNNRTGAYKQYLFENNKREIYPDFIYKPVNDGNVISSGTAILDAKYKRTKSNDIDREDAFQMISYMSRFKASHSYLIYPRKDGENLLGDSFVVLNHPELTVHKIGFRIPSYSNEATFEEFSEKMKDSEDDLINSLKEHLENP